MPRTWFTSDLHFGHKNIIKYCARPFWKRSPAETCEPDSHVMVPDTDDMNEALVENWNSVVAPDDTVWNLGDVGFCVKESALVVLLSQLNGKHHLVLGNHDDAAKSIFAYQTETYRPFVAVHPGLYEIEIEGQLIVLCHYPIRDWHHCNKGAWHLFGHTHGLLRPHGKSVDVGVDNVAEILGAVPASGTQPMTLYRPVSFEEVKAFMDARTVGPHAEFQGYAPARADV